MWGNEFCILTINGRGTITQWEKTYGDRGAAVRAFQDHVKQFFAHAAVPIHFETLRDGTMTEIKIRREVPEESQAELAARAIHRAIGHDGNRRA